MSLASSSASEIGVLKASSIFAMSLGAKELFHTNFLAFLLGSDDPSLQPIQRAVRQALNFPPSPSAVPQCAVWREKNNMDLVVVELEALNSTKTLTNSGLMPASSSGVTGSLGNKNAANHGWDWNQGSHWTNSSSGTASSPQQGRSPQLSPTGRILIIEAKLKSIPNLSQLINYDNIVSSISINLKFPEESDPPDWVLCFGAVNSLKMGNGKPTTLLTICLQRTLLSITGVSMTTPATRVRSSGVWAGVSWSALQQAMTSSIVGLAPSPLIPVLDDYAKSLDALIKLIDRSYQMCDDARHSSAIPPYRAMRSQTQESPFKSLRINDLLGKALFDYWLNNYVLLRLSGLSTPAGWALRSYTHYSRGEPGFGIELVKDQFQMPSQVSVELRIGIQIQNKDLRLSISTNLDYIGLEAWIAQHQANLINIWFSHVALLGQAPKGKGGQSVQQLKSPVKGRLTNLKVFGVNRFLYSAIDIDGISITDIENVVCDLMKHACNLAPVL